MKIVDKYISISILKIFALSLFVFLFIGLLTRVVHYSDLFTNGGAAVSDIFLILSLVQPKIISILAPFTLFIACFITYNSLIHANEHIAIYNLGRGNSALLRPFFFVSSILFILLLILTTFVVPYSYRKMELIQRRIALKLTSAILKPQEFVEQKNILIFINDVNSQKLAEGIFIADLRKPKEKMFAVANEGTIGFNGVNISLNSRNTSIFKQIEGVPYPVISFFKDYQVLLSVIKGSDDSFDTGYYSISITSLIQDLRVQMQDKNSSKVQSILGEIKLRIGWPFFIILIPFSIISCFLKFFNFTRNKPSVLYICYSILIVAYVSISGIAGIGILNGSVFQFSLYYLNEILIFIFLLFIAKNKSS
jgi:lipopolysaccharide export LptBFGC system permease protein LptF